MKSKSHSRRLRFSFLLVALQVCFLITAFSDNYSLFNDGSLGATLQSEQLAALPYQIYESNSSYPEQLASLDKEDSFFLNLTGQIKYMMGSIPPFVFSVNPLFLSTTGNVKEK